MRDLRAELEKAEAELRLALLSERADIRGSGIRRLMAEIRVNKAREACLVSKIRVRDSFGPCTDDDGAA